MLYIILLINLWAFEAGFAFPQRNEDQQPDVFSRHLRQATRLKKKYVPFVDGKPILIPDTEPEKRENHVYDAEAEKAFLQSYLFPQHDGKPAKKGDLKTVKNKEYEASTKKPKQRIPTSKPVSKHQNKESKNLREGETKEESHEYEYDSPVVVESATSVLMETWTKIEDEKPVGIKNIQDQDYDEPVAIEAVIKKPYQTKEAQIGDYDTPVVIEALVKKDSTKIKPTVLVEGKVKYDGTVSEAFTKNTEITGGDNKESDVYGKEEDNQYKNSKSPVVHALGVSEGNDKSKASHYKRKDKLNPTKSSIKDEVEPLGGRASGTDVPTFESKGSMNTDGATSSSRNFLPLDSNVWSFLASIQSQERSKFKPCQTASGQPGNCMPIQLCPAVDQLGSNICVIDEVFVGFCCPETVQWDEGKKNSSGCGSAPESIDTGNIWPWMVTLVSDQVFCGGVLISERVVLAAAHCTKRIPLNRILVRVRSLESPLPFETVEVVEIKRHAQYNPKSMLNDLALLKLSKKLKSATPICLPDANQDYVGETGILLGWKAAEGDTKDVEWLPIISKEDCRFAESILCTEPRAVEGTCNADGGSPLVLNVKGKFTLIGLLTWNRHECGQPTIFTRVASFRNWIDKHIS